MEGKYVQMTLNDWLALKGQLEAELRGAAAGFVRIGFLLRKIEESKGYENDGSKNLAEWAKDNYGLSATAVSRASWPSIENTRSMDTVTSSDSNISTVWIREAVGDAGTSGFRSRDGLTGDEKEDIREIKKFNKEAAKRRGRQTLKNPMKTGSIAEEPHEEPPAASPTELPDVLPEHKWIIEFFKANKEIMNDLYSSKAYEEENTEGMKEIVNPRGRGHSATR